MYIVGSFEAFMYMYVNIVAFTVHVRKLHM